MVMTEKGVGRRLTIRVSGVLLAQPCPLRIARCQPTTYTRPLFLAERFCIGERLRVLHSTQQARGDTALRSKRWQPHRPADLMRRASSAGGQVVRAWH